MLAPPQGGNYPAHSTTTTHHTAPHHALRSQPCQGPPNLPDRKTTRSNIFSRTLSLAQPTRDRLSVSKVQLPAQQCSAAAITEKQLVQNITGKMKSRLEWLDDPRPLHRDVGTLREHQGRGEAKVDRHRCVLVLT